MLNRDLYSKQVRTIILKIKKISDSTLQMQAIETFKQILIASFSSAPISLTAAAPNYAILQEITLVDFAHFVQSTLSFADYNNVQDLLVEKSDMFGSIGIDIDYLLEHAAQDSRAIIDIEPPTLTDASVAVEATEEEVLPVEEQGILTSISGIDPDNGRHYFLSSQRQMVIDYIRARLAFSKAVLLSKEMRTAQNRCTELRESLSIASQGLISFDSEQNPMLFTKINDACAPVAMIARKRFIGDVIKGYPVEDLARLPSERFSSVYTAAVNINGNLQAVNHMLEYFMQTQAKCIPLQSTISFTAQFGGDLTLDNVAFTMTSPDLLMGYTLHNMLLVNQQIATSSPFDACYEGQRTFNINKKSLLQLRQYLSELKTWYADFEVILACLFGNKGTVAQYTKTGQKALTEIINIEEVRKRDRLPPLINEATIRELKSISNPELRTVLLIGQVALDLTEHPDRDNMKRFFESLYRIHGFKDAKGEPKTFIKAPGYDYISLLSISNIQGIFQDIMAQAGLTAIAQEMGYASANAEEFLSLMDASSLIELYNQQLGAKLAELPIFTLRPDGRFDTCVSAKQVIRTLATAANFHQPGNQDFGMLRRNFDTRLKKMLNQLCSIALQAAGDLSPELSVVERQELERLLSAQHLAVPASVSRDDLLAERRRALLSEASRRAGYGSIKTVGDIEHLFASFKTCDAYTALSVVYEQRRQEILREGGLCDDLPTLMMMFENEFKRRMQSAGSSASSSPYYGYIPLDLTNDVLLQSFATMYHQDRTRVTTASMVNYFLTIAELATTDSRGHRDMSHCDKGFAGRVAGAAVCLAFEGTNPLKDIELGWRRGLVDTVSNRVLRDGSESSMKFANLPYILHELGLGPQPVADDRNKNDAVIRDYLNAFAKVCTPAALYDEYYQAMLNNFKAYTVDEPTDEDITNLYQLFQMLGFTSNRDGDVTQEDKEKLDREFRVNPHDPDSKWNLSKFTYHLPEKLIETLIINTLLIPNHARRNSQELITLARRSLAVPATVAEPVVAVAQATVASRADGFAGMSASMGFGDLRAGVRDARDTARSATTVSQGSAGWGSFFGSTPPEPTAATTTRPPAPAMEDVRRVANSSLTQQPNYTSSS